MIPDKFTYQRIIIVALLKKKYRQHFCMTSVYLPLEQELGHYFKHDVFNYHQFLFILADQRR